MKTYTVRGHIVGEIWWPIGALCGKPFSAELKRDRPLFDELADALNDGDFSSAPKLSADSWIVIEHTDRKPHGIVRNVRYVDVAVMPSIAELVNDEVYGSDFDGE